MRVKTMTLGLIAAVMLAAPCFGADQGADPDTTADATIGASVLAAIDAAADATADTVAARGAPESATAIAGPGAKVYRGPSIFFASVLDGANAANVFRVFNVGRTAGTVTATIYDGATGNSLGTWTSASVPVLGAIEVSAATILAGATPALTATQRSASLNFAVTATFRGAVQRITRTANALINQSNCGAFGNTLGYVEGPGFTGVTGAVRIANVGPKAGTITLSLREPATGKELGKWTSASVPAHAVVTMTSAAIAAAATPAVAATTTALNIVPIAATAWLGIEHLATMTASTTVSNLSAACGI